MDTNDAMGRDVCQEVTLKVSSPYLYNWAAYSLITLGIAGSIGAPVLYQIWWLNFLNLANNIYKWFWEFQQQSIC